MHKREESWDATESGHLRLKTSPGEGKKREEEVNIKTRHTEKKKKKVSMEKKVALRLAKKGLKGGLTLERIGGGCKEGGRRGVVKIMSPKRAIEHD